MDGRGGQMSGIITNTNLCLLNDGRAACIDDRTSKFSDVYLSLASPGIHQYFTWEPCGDSLRSDHFETVLSISPICVTPFRPLRHKSLTIGRRADWVSFSNRACLGVSRETCIRKVFTKRRVPLINLLLDGHPVPFQNSGKFLGIHIVRKNNF